jgi:hypothetical protein
MAFDQLHWDRRRLSRRPLCHCRAGLEDVDAGAGDRARYEGYVAKDQVSV